MEQKFKLASVVNDTGGTTTFDAYDFVGMIAQSDESIGNPKNPVKSTVVVDVADDNVHAEIHLDTQFLSMLDLTQDLTVKRFSPNKQVVTLDGAELEFAKAILVGIEFEFQGEIYAQGRRIELYKNTNATKFTDYQVQNPQIFSDTINVVYNKETNEITFETSGEAIPSVMKIIDVKGVF